ncbi:MAG: O-antigen ligase family protein [Candidatus Sumerlaeia bacterium]|nr:O-antigen ligase family protein [Candidatus Sumerlaeia bacterium]
MDPRQPLKAATDALVRRDAGAFARWTLAGALPALLLLLPFEDGTLAGRVACAALVPLAALLAVWRGGMDTAPLGGLRWALLALAAATLASAAQSIAPSASLAAWCLGMAPLLALFAATHLWLCEDPARRGLLARGFAAAAVLVAVVSLAGFATGDWAERHFDSLGRPYLRAVGPFDSYGRLALFATLASPLLLAVSLVEWRRGRRGLALGLGAALGGLLIALLLTQTRAGWVAAALALGAVAAQHRRLLFAGLAALLLAGAAAFPFIGNRVTATLRDAANPHTFLSERPELWATGIEAIRDRPLLGIGYGPDIFKSPAARRDYPLFNHKEQTDLHSVYLQQLAESGVLGALAFAAAIGMALGRALASRPLQWVRSLADLDEQRLWTWAALAGIGGLLLFGLVFNFHKDRIAFYFWVLLALASSAPRRSLSFQASP